MSLGPLEIIETKVLRPLKYSRLAHNGFLYHFHKKCTHHLRWKCYRVYSQKCPAVLKTNMDMLNLEYIAVDHEHVHDDDLIAIETLKFKINVHQKSTYFNQNTCFKPKDLDNFGEEIHSPENISNNKLARFCATMNQVFFVDPLDHDYNYGNINKCEEIIKNNNSRDTSIDFENFPYDKLKQKNNQNQIKIQNSKNGLTKNQTNYSFFNGKLKKYNQNQEKRSQKESNMIVRKKKKNNVQKNESTLFTNTHKEINNLNTKTRKVKNSLNSNMHKNKNTLRNIINKRKCILTTNTHKKKNMITNKKKKSILNTNACRKIISLKAKLKKNTSKFTNQNSPTITNTPIIISTPTILTTTTNSSPTVINILTNESTIINKPTITSTPTILTSETISIPTITSTQTILTPETISTPSVLPCKITSSPIIIDTPTLTSTSIIDTPTLTSTPIIIDIPTLTSTPTILTPKTISTSMVLTHEIIDTPTITSRPTIICSTSTITSSSTIDSAPAILSTSTILTSTLKNAPIITSLPSFNSTHTIERCTNKSINYEDEIIVIDSDNSKDGCDGGFISDSDDDSICDFDEVKNCNEEINNKINKINLVHDDIMVLMYCKKNWSAILNKMRDPLTGIKVFESILFNKVLIRMMRGNNRTKRKVQILKRRNDHWKLKFNCLVHKINTLVNSTKSDKNTRLVNIQNRNKKNTALSTNIRVNRQENNIGVKKKVYTKLKNKIKPENLKTSKSNQQYLNSKNKYLSESLDSDILTNKSEKINTDKFSSSVIVDLIKDIPEDTTISRISPKPFHSEENYLTQSNCGIEITQPKIIEPNKHFIPVSNIPITSQLSPKSLKRKISNLIRNNTSIELTKAKVKKCNKPSTLETIDLTKDSLPDMMASKLSSKLLNSQITNPINTAIEMTESSIIEYHEPSKSGCIDITITNLPAKKNSRLSAEKNIFTEYNNGTELIPSVSTSTDSSSNIPTFSSSSINEVTSLNNNVLLNKAVNPALCIGHLSDIELLIVDKSSQLSTVNLNKINVEKWNSPRKMTIFPKLDSSTSSVSKAVILPFALKRLSKPNNLLTNSNTTIQLDKRNILNTSVIPVETKTSLPDVVYESTQIMNTINCEETIQSNYSHNEHESPNQIKSVPKAIPLSPSEIINDFSSEV